MEWEKKHNFLLQEGFTNGESARRMPECGHVFHLLCINKRLLEHGSCPMCRKEINIIAT